MTDTATGTGVEPERAVPPAEAAMALLRDAEAAAERIRADADRYARRRAHEADLLVARARRLLVAAEERAAVVVATARAEARQVIDLDALAAAPDPAEEAHPRAGRPGRSSRLDDLFASAIATAVGQALQRHQRT